jgi:hypothetical protein
MRWVNQPQLTHKEIRVGTGVVRTYEDWQVLLKDPKIGGVIGVDHFFTEDENGL